MRNFTLLTKIFSLTAWLLLPVVCSALAVAFPATREGLCLIAMFWFLGFSTGWLCHCCFQVAERIDVINATLSSRRETLKQQGEEEEEEEVECPKEETI